MVDKNVLQKNRYLVVTDRELELLHRCVEYQMKDLEARLAAAIELPLDELQYREGLVALLPEHLQSAARRLIVYNEGDEHVAIVVWCEADVFMRARERRVKGLTREMAQEIIDTMDDKQDAEYGLTWSNIDSGLDDLLADKKITEEGVDIERDEEGIGGEEWLKATR